MSVAGLGTCGRAALPTGPPDGAPVSGRFRLVPFLVELRAVMDWVWTDTTLSLSNWMCVEDIYANIFIIKCSREMEKVPGPWGGGSRGLPTGAPPGVHSPGDMSPESITLKTSWRPEGLLRGDSECGRVGVASHRGA